MLEFISERLTNRLIRNNIIESDDRDIYRYGINQLLLTVLNIVTTIIIGIIFGEIWKSILFVTAFMIIRIYAGGYHASTPYKCYLLTNLIIVAALSVMKYIQMGNFICFVLLVVSSALILSLSPVESENKQLDDIEKMIYRKKTIMVWCVEVVTVIVFTLLGYSEVSNCIVLSQVVLSLSQVIGKLEVYVKNRDNIKKHFDNK